MSQQDPSTAAFVAKWAPVFSLQATYVDCGSYGYTAVEDMREIIPETRLKVITKRAPLKVERATMEALHADVDAIFARGRQNVEGVVKVLAGIVGVCEPGTPPARVALALHKAASALYYGEVYGIQAAGSTGGSWDAEE